MDGEILKPFSKQPPKLWKYQFSIAFNFQFSISGTGAWDRPHLKRRFQSHADRG
jgi:hypothetical protein